MNIPENYLEINKDCWDKRTGAHLSSAFYDMEGFIAGASSLQETELALLGDVRGKSVLHLQCHFGQDTLSLARLGAQATGMDLSDKAIDKAKQLNEQLHLSADFICCDLYDLPRHLQKQYDIVFTSYGTIGWLPDLHKWAQVIRQALKPGGRFVMVDFHPVIWMFDNTFSHIQHSYFNVVPIIDQTEGTYADTDADISYQEIGWNHSLDEIWNALSQNGLDIKYFREYDFAHYNCFEGMEQIGEKKYRIKRFGDKVPLMYSFEAR